MTMPVVALNRIVTDSITDYFFTTSKSASENFIENGIDSSNVHFVGNVMIDTLHQNLNRISPPSFWNEFGLETGNYIILTLHRPSNVDEEEQSLIDLLEGIDRIVAIKK
jgi:UDP-N-acetylglucosamine 2-epimerase (non-hydrolysing)